MTNNTSVRTADRTRTAAPQHSNDTIVVQRGEFGPGRRSVTTPEKAAVAARHAHNLAVYGD